MRANVVDHMLWEGLAWVAILALACLIVGGASIAFAFGWWAP